MWIERVIRRYDSLNRVTIPSEWCKKLNFQFSQEVEVIMEYGKISIKKYNNQDVSKLPYFGVLRTVTTNGRLTIPAEYISLCGITNKLILDLYEDKVQIYGMLKEDF